MRINDPKILAEIEKAFLLYEHALMANDLDILDNLFWPNALTVRFGPGQNLYGIDAIRAFRVNRTGGSPRRTLSNTLITTFGNDFATANTEFQREGAQHPGRQSQTWCRMEEGWRIVSAHISFLGDGS